MSDRELDQILTASGEILDSTLNEVDRCGDPLLVDWIAKRRREKARLYSAASTVYCFRGDPI